MKKIILITLLTITRITAQEPTQAATKSGFGFRGLAIEAFGQYSFQPAFSASTSLANPTLGGNAQTRVEYKDAAMDGYGAGGNLVFDFLPNVSLLIGGQYKSLSKVYRDFNYEPTKTGNAVIISATSTNKAAYQYALAHLGPRIRLPIFGGEIFCGLGVGLVLPFKYTFTADYEYLKGYESISFSDANGVTTSTYPRTRNYALTVNSNIAMVGVMEFGYQYEILNRLSLAVSLNLVYGSVTNINKTSTYAYTFTDGSTSQSTQENKSSYTLAERTASPNSAGAYTNLNITDIGIRGAISVRLF